MLAVLGQKRAERKAGQIRNAQRKLLDLIPHGVVVVVADQVCGGPVVPSGGREGSLQAGPAVVNVQASRATVVVSEVPSWVTVVVVGGCVLVATARLVSAAKAGQRQRNGESGASVRW